MSLNQGTQGTQVTLLNPKQLLKLIYKKIKS